MGEYQFSSQAVFDAVMDRDTSNTMNYVAFFVSLAVGAIFSFIAFKVEKAGFFALGALGGVTIALIASNIIQSEDKVITGQPIFGPIQLTFLATSVCSLGPHGCLRIYLWYSMCLHQRVSILQDVILLPS